MVSQWAVKLGGDLDLLRLDTQWRLDLLRSGPQWRSNALRSFSLTGFALWKKTGMNFLTCKHDENSCLSFSALLIAYVDIIPYLFSCVYLGIIQNLGVGIGRYFGGGGKFHNLFTLCSYSVHI